MRILYDHQVFSLQDAGGASRYHYELMRNLQAFDEVAIELLMGVNRSVLPFSRLRQSNTRVFSLHGGIQPGRVRYGVNELFSSFAGPLRGVFEIYHPTLYRALPWVRRQRLVVTHHDCIHERFPQLFRNSPAIVEAKRKLFAQAHAIVCVSASSRADLHHFYDVPQEKTHVVHHGFSALPGPLADRPAASTERPYLLYVGSRAGYKNFDLLLEAFSRTGLAGSYQLLAAGGGAWSALERERITGLGLSSSISLLPRPDEATLARAYQGARLFVYPSLYEGFGFPPLEAMSLGCPVLANRTSSLPEVCGDAALYFDATDAEGFGFSLIATLGDDAALAQARGAGKQRVKLYSWQRCAQSTLEIYQSVLGSRGCLRNGH